jgi:hypothetical protein
MTQSPFVRLPAALVAAVCLACPAFTAAGDVASEIHTVLPPDAIRAVLQPEFVPVTEARVEDTAAMIGVVLNGEAHAYSAVLLNAHEIVNDVVGDTKVATTW